MAYMNQEKKQELAAGIKEVLKKYKMKGTISVSNHSTLVVTVTSGVLDIPANIFEVFNKEAEWKGYEPLHNKPSHIQVNEYYIEEQYSGVARDFLLELKEAMNIGNYNHSDIQSDYFDVGFYTNINIGKWNKPFKLTT